MQHLCSGMTHTSPVSMLNSPDADTQEAHGLLRGIPWGLDMPHMGRADQAPERHTWPPAMCRCFSMKPPNCMAPLAR